METRRPSMTVGDCFVCLAVTKINLPFLDLVRYCRVKNIDISRLHVFRMPVPHAVLEL